MNRQNEVVEEPEPEPVSVMDEALFLKSLVVEIVWYIWENAGRTLATR